MNYMNSLAICLLATCLGAGTASAAKPAWAGKDKHQPTTGEATAQPEGSGEHGRQLFSEREKELIRAYYRGEAGMRDDQKTAKQARSDKGSGKQQHSLPPGLQKKLARTGTLPPGWQNKVIAGEVLDNELYGQSDVVPQELDILLDEVVGAETRRIGNKVVKLVQGDATIIDVIDISDAILSNY